MEAVIPNLHRRDLGRVLLVFCQNGSYTGLEGTVFQSPDLWLDVFFGVVTFSVDAGLKAAMVVGHGM